MTYLYPKNICTGCRIAEVIMSIEQFMNQQIPIVQADLPTHEDMVTLIQESLQTDNQKGKRTALVEAP